MSDDNNCCSGKTKHGKPCRAAAMERGLCYLHTNPGRAAELGRIGGRKNRHVVNEVLRPLPAMDSNAGVRAAAEQMLADMYSGRLQPKKAAGLAALMNTLLRALGTTDIEQKFKQIEARLDELSDPRIAPSANKTTNQPNLHSFPTRRPS